MLEVKCTIKDIDFEGIILKYLPVVLEKVNQPLANEIIGILGTKSEAVIRAIFKELTEEQKEKILCSCVDAFDDKIISALNGLLKENEITLNIDSIEANVIK